MIYLLSQVNRGSSNSTKVCIEFVKEESKSDVAGGNAMPLNSPLIPTITTDPDIDGHVLKLKYTLPSGVTVYSPKVPIKAKKSEGTERNDRLAAANVNVNKVFRTN